LPCRRIVDFSDPGIFKANATSHDPNFIVEVVGGVIQNGVMELEIRSAYGDDKTRLHDELGDENYEFDITVSSDNIHITDPRIEVRVVNRPERVLELKGLSHQEDDLGKSVRHEAFLFSAASAPDTLSIDLAPVFNDRGSPRPRFGLHESIGQLQRRHHHPFQRPGTCRLMLHA